MAVNPNVDFVAGAVLTASQQNRFPRGVMAYYIGGADQTIGTTITDVTGASLTFTAVANRLYRATFEALCYGFATGDNIVMFTDAANTQLDQIQPTIVANTYIPICFQYVFTTTAGSKNYKVRANGGSGNIKFYGGGSRTYSFVIEDIGPA